MSIKSIPSSLRGGAVRGGRPIAILLVATMASAVAASNGLPAERPSTVVLITVDTLRADHLGCYGYPRSTSPFIDRLASEGVVFERAFSMSSTTAPSHASILTGTYPLQHGVMKNGQRLPAGMFTMAEAMRRAGFTTAAFVSTHVHFRHGRMNQGFDVFDQAPRFEESQGLPANAVQRRSAAGTVDKAIEWMTRRDTEERLFLWVHLFDPHTPYAESNVLAVDEKDAEALTDFYRRQHYLETTEFREDPAAVLRTMSLYDGEVRYMDRELGRLFDEVVERNKGHGGKAMWILTADHGEGLGNHNWMGHGKNLYNELVRVPLIFWFSDGSPGGRRVESVVEHVDLLPTVADVVGLDINHAPSIRGESFLPLLLGEDARRRKQYAFSQRRHYDNHSAIEATSLGYESGARYALQERRYKYVHWTEGPDEFYDLASDPFEIRDLIGKGLPDEERMRKALLEMVATLSVQSESIVQPTPDDGVKERLRALGYTQ